MLQIQKIRDEKDAVMAGLQKKFFGELEAVEKIIALDAEKRKTQAEGDEMLATMNRTSKEIGALMGQGKKDEA